MAIPSESLQNGSLMGLETEQKEVYELIPLACSRGMLGLGLLPQGCCNKLPHIWWLKTTEVYSLTVMEARSLKSRLRLGHTHSKGPGRGEPFLSASGLQRPLACGCVFPTSASVFMWPYFLGCHASFFLSLDRTLIIGFRAHPNQSRMILSQDWCHNYLHSK